MSSISEKAAMLAEIEEWEPPIPFDEIDTPSFPIAVLPSPLGNLVAALAESTQTPSEMGGLLALGVLATASQRLYEVEITSDWREPLGLYTVAVAPPGERKSAVISALTAPLTEYEADLNQRQSAEIDRSQATYRTLQKQLEQAEKMAATGKGDIADVEAASDRLNEFKPMSAYRLVADDTTPEKLINLMASQEGKLCISSAEGGVFDAMSGRYDKAANFDVYLKAHAGDSIRVDRVNRAADYIQRPCLSMLLTIQPDVLQGLLSNPTFRGRGLCGRFLYDICHSKVGRRDIDPPPVSDKLKLDYRRLIYGMLARKETGIITLSDEAQTVRKSFAQTVENNLAEGGDFEFMRDWGGKLVGAMVRIAAVIHAAETAEPIKARISAETMERAVRIAVCLGLHAQAAYQTMGADDRLEDAKYLWRRICESGQAEISKRNLFDLTKGKFKTVDEMMPALAELSDMHYIRVDETATGQRGRPTVKIKRNPLTQK